MIGTLLACLSCFEYNWLTFWAWLPHFLHDCHVLSMNATMGPCVPCFDYYCHTVGMYISTEWTFKTNVHLAYHWSCLPHSVYYWHTVAMFATFWLWLPLFGHVCHILIMIAILWPCLPRFDDDCHSVSMFATFWVLLPHCGNVCHFLIMIATLWAGLPHF